MAEGRLALLWDLDGTLVDLRIDISDVRRWKRLLGERFEARGWTGAWSPMLPALESALVSVGADQEEREAVYSDLDRWESEALAGVFVRDAALRVSSSLCGRGVPQAIVTNNGPGACMRGREALAARAFELGLAAPSFGAVVSRGPAHRAKPAPDILFAALCALADGGDEAGRGALGRALVVGDQPGDRAATEALGALGGLEVGFIEATPSGFRVGESARRLLAPAGLGGLFANVSTSPPGERGVT